MKKIINNILLSLCILFFAFNFFEAPYAIGQRPAGFFDCDGDGSYECSEAKGEACASVCPDDSVSRDGLCYLMGCECGVLDCGDNIYGGGCICTGGGCRVGQKPSLTGITVKAENVCCPTCGYSTCTPNSDCTASVLANLCSNESCFDGCDYIKGTKICSSNCGIYFSPSSLTAPGSASLKVNPDSLNGGSLGKLGNGYNIACSGLVDWSSGTIVDPIAIGNFEKVFSFNAKQVGQEICSIRRSQVAGGPILCTATLVVSAPSVASCTNLNGYSNPTSGMKLCAGSSATPAVSTPYNYVFSCPASPGPCTYTCNK